MSATLKWRRWCRCVSSVATSSNATTGLLPSFCIAKHLTPAGLEDAQSSYLSKCGRSDPHVIAVLHISGWDSGDQHARTALQSAFAAVMGSTEEAVAISSVTGETDLSDQTGFLVQR